MNRSRGNRQDDAFSAKAAKEPLPQLVLDAVLVDEGRDMVPHREVQGGFAEPGDEAHRRGGIAQEAWDRADGARGLIEQYRLDVIEIHRVLDADLQAQGQATVRQAEIGDRGARDRLVRHDDDRVGEGSDARGPPPDVDHEALGVVGHLDVVAHPDRPVCEEMDAREEVRQRVLQREGDGDAADAQGGKDGRNLHTHGGQEYEHPHDQHRDAGRGVREPRDRPAERLPVANLADGAARELGERDRHGENHGDFEEQPESFVPPHREERRVTRDLVRDIESGHRAPEQGRRPDRGSDAGP